jgi:methylenetetrahydrofolate dehydrogenase (NADP+)/methenyltetrahydrofolate cyclohydrolase
MSAIIIDGKRIAELIKDKARELLVHLSKENLYPQLSVILVGGDPASQVYVRQKEKACQSIGLKSNIIRLPEDCSQSQLDDTVASQAINDNVVGILVQLPLPKHLNAESAMGHIPFYKDVDGFDHINTGHLWKNGEAKHIACTPAGIMFALKESGVELAGKHAVIVGRSNTVGKPLAALLLKNDATVTVCHSKTTNLCDYTKQADILIAAAGKPKLITADMVKQGAIVVDVGINRVDGKLIGDIDFDTVKEVASMITPVPGGVGPLTVAMLMLNAARAAWIQKDYLRLANANERGGMDE